MCYKVFCHILEHETRFWEHDGFSSLTPRTHTKSQTIDWTTIRCERVNKSPLNNWILPFSVSKTEKYIFSPSYRHSPPNRFCASLRVMFADWVIKTNAESVHQMLFPAAASREYSFRTKLDLSLFWLKRFWFFFFPLMKELNSDQSIKYLISLDDVVFQPAQKIIKKQPSLTL